MTGAYAHDWPGRGAWADHRGHRCGPDSGRYGAETRGGRSGRETRGGWTSDEPRGGRSGRGGRGGRGGFSGPPLEALAAWAFAGAREPRRHGPRGLAPEDLEKIEALIAMRRMRGRGPSPFGRGGRGPRGRGRRRRGDVRLAVLRLLAEEPRNGYQLMQTIEERSGGRWRPSPGSMYPTLSQLEDEQLIESTEADGGRRFTITEAGRTALEERAGEPDPWVSEPDPDEHAMSELGPLVLGIGQATWQVAAVADATQRAQAAELLAETRRRLYGILAESPAEAESPGEAEAPDTDDQAAGDDAPSGD